MSDTTDTEIVRLRRENLRLRMENNCLRDEIDIANLTIKRLRYNLNLDAGQIYRLLEMNTRLVEANTRMTWTAVTREPMVYGS